MKYAELGTVSHGTMRTEDLLETFSAELEALVHNNAEAWCSDIGRAERDCYMGLIHEAREVDCESDEAADVLYDLFDALGDFAPSGACFGSHPGDDSDFGFWQDEEQELSAR